MLSLRCREGANSCADRHGSWCVLTAAVPAVCQYIAEQHNQQHGKGSQRQSSGGNETRSSDGMPAPSGGFNPLATAVADGVWHMTIGCTSAPRGPGVGAHLPAASHQASCRKGSMSGLP